MKYSRAIVLQLVLGFAALFPTACSTNPAASAAPAVALAASATAWHKETLVPRPILYFSMADVEGKKRGVTKAVFADGRSQGVLADSPGAVWSPNGEWFASVSFDSKQVNLGNPKGEMTAILSAEPQREFVPSVAWSPDSEKIAVITMMPEQNDPGLGLLIVDVATRETVSRHPLAGSSQSNLWVAPTKFRWSPDGQKILIVWQSTAVVDVTNGGSETISDSTLAAEWTPDSQAVYFLGFSDAAPPELESFNVKPVGPGEARKLADKNALAKLGMKSNGTTASLGLLGLSPDATRIALVGGVDKGSVVYIFDLSESGAIAFDNPAGRLQTTEPIIALDWAPESNGLAFVTVSSKPAEGDYSEYSLNLQYWDLNAAHGKSLDSIPIGRYAWYLSQKLALMQLLNFKLLSWSQ